MKPYILKVGHIGLISEGKYAAHIAIMDSDSHCFTGIAYKTIVVDAINEEFARKIADIRIEEMMIKNESEIDSIYDKNILIETKRNYSKKYAELVAEMDQLRKKQENLLTALVKEAQQSAEEGLDIKDLGIEVELDGFDKKIYAVRVVSEDREGGSVEWLELKILDYYLYEWYNIYDFYSDTADKILSEIMENL